MSALLIAACQPLAGKTAVAVGLAQQLAHNGRRIGLLRLAGDEGATADAHLFASLPFNADHRRQPISPSDAAQSIAGIDIAIIEATAGDLSADVRALAARFVVAARYPELTDGRLPTFCRSLGDALLGVVATAVPRRRLESARQSLADAGLGPMALVPEDRTLAAPTISELADALAAQTMFLNHQRQQVLDRILISSISADPGQGYFARYSPNAVIVRSDKPDLQLAALNAGAPCLILTSAGGGSALGGGGLPPLSYVLQRAEEDEIPLLLTQHDTRTAVGILEDLYLRTRFAGQAKIQRIAQLLAETLDAAAITALTQTK